MQMANNSRERSSFNFVLHKSSPYFSELYYR
nr:MAG TPA: hypothetical protein [Caudoviricetes sp.]